MQRVILLPHGFQPEYEAGFANGLARNGVRVTLIGSDMTLCDRLDPSVENINLRRSQNPRRAAWNKALNLMRYWFECFTFLLRNRGVPVHVIGTFTTGKLWISLIEAWLTRWAAGPYILTVHNLLPHDQHSPINAWLSRHIYRTAAVCMAHTRLMKNELVSEFGLDPDKVVVVEHGIDRLLPRTESSRRGMRARLALPEENRVILFFGNIVPYKGLDILLRAYDLLTDQSHTTLLIAGRCKEPSLREWLRGETETREGAGGVRWLDGYIPEEDVAPLFHAADLLVMPYRHIDQSGVVFMAMTTGLPVVASDVGALRDYIPSECGAVIPPEDPTALALALDSWLDRAHGEAAIPSTVAEHFYWSRTVAPMLPIYAQLARG
jgi:glycosyltransferase involved in cell wall biosynthesis